MYWTIELLLIVGSLPRKSDDTILPSMLFLSFCKYIHGSEAYLCVAACIIHCHVVVPRLGRNLVFIATSKFSVAVLACRKGCCYSCPRTTSGKWISSYSCYIPVNLHSNTSLGLGPSLLRILGKHKDIGPKLKEVTVLCIYNTLMQASEHVAPSKQRLNRIKIGNF